MEVIYHPDLLRAALSGWRAAGQSIALVPTMGNLHAGHLALVERARMLCDRVVTSIYVNPTQFGPQEDLAAYPRTPQADCAALQDVGCDLVWMPGDEVMYPHGLTRSVKLVAPAALAGVLCGLRRPGHFDGVLTAVIRLFSQIVPHVAVFGEKDYQQLQIIRHMVTDLSLPIRIESLPTVRAPDGLALSSRNRYLTPAQREKAPALYSQLRLMSDKMQQTDDFQALETNAMTALAKAGFEPEYVAVRDAENLGPAQAGRPLRVFAAARLGAARLIDNLAVGKA